MNCVKRAAVLIFGTFFFASSPGFAQQKKLYPKPTAASFQKSDKARLEKRRLNPQQATVSIEKSVLFNSKGLLLKKPAPVSNSIFSAHSPVTMSCEETYAPYSVEKGPALKECHTVKVSAVYDID